MDYQQSRAYIKDAEKYGSVLGLSGMREMMKRLGNPQDSVKFIHVAGTNGKGSVIAYLYTVLSHAGYRTGRYISPTIYSYRERMEVSGEQITREKFAGYVSEVADVIEEMTRDGISHPTPFEIETAVAFLFFRDENCDLVLLEVGMGGDLDATNIIKENILAVITSISMDHQAFLGNTLAEIAEKKAGIVKPGCKTVTAAQRPEVEEIIRKKCQEDGAELFVCGREEAEVLEESCLGQSFLWKGEKFEISLAGVYQTQNASLALEALAVLEKCGYPVSLDVKKEGLKKTRWGGRFTVIHQKPLIVVDGAHNPDAAEKLAESVRHYFSGKTIYYIMGVFRDKDYRSIIRTTCPYAEKVFAIQTPDNPRALPAEELAGVIREYQTEAQALESVEEAVRAALSLADKEDVILAFGSLSFIGTLTGIVKKLADER